MIYFLIIIMKIKLLFKAFVTVFNTIILRLFINCLFVLTSFVRTSNFFHFVITNTCIKIVKLLDSLF